MEHEILLGSLSKKNLLSYVADRVYTKQYWPDLFPLKTWPYLTWEALIGAKGAPVAADIVAYESSAPEKTRKVVTKKTGNIPPTRVKRGLSETDINLYNQIKAMANPDMDQLHDLVFNDIDFVIESVLAQMEIMALKLISSGKIVIKNTTNVGPPTVTAVDYGASYTTGASATWSSNAATRKPITDIEAIVRKGALLGVKYNYILMDRQSWLYLKTADETVAMLVPYGFVGILDKRNTASITEEFVNQMLKDNAWPQVIVVDQSITTETEDHVQITSNPFYDGHICFVESFPLGNMLSGPIAEETNPPKQAIQAKSGNILVSKWRGIDPVTEWTKGESNVFPTWPLIDRCYLLDTLNQTNWTDPT